MLPYAAMEQRQVPQAVSVVLHVLIAKQDTNVQEVLRHLAEEDRIPMPGSQNAHLVLLAFIVRPVHQHSQLVSLLVVRSNMLPSWLYKMQRK